MFRAAVLSIVFSLAVGQNVALLCRPWCDAHLAAAGECHHKDSPSRPRVGGNESCDDVVTAATAVLKEDIRRDISSPDSDQAVPLYQLPQFTIDARVGEKPWNVWLLEKRPLATALRI